MAPPQERFDNGAIDIDSLAILLRVAATVLTMAALFVWARVGPGAFAAGLFTVLTALAFESRSGWARSLDGSVDAWVLAHRSRESQVEAAKLFAAFGEPAYVGLFAVGFGVLLSLLARSWIRGVVLLGAVAVGILIEETLKLVLESFPSGHVMGTATLLGLIAVLLSNARNYAVKTGLALLVVSAVVFVAALAVYCGSHSVTDVLGGMVLGGAMVSLGVAVVNAVESRDRRAQQRRSSPDRDVRSRVPVA